MKLKIPKAHRLKTGSPGIISFEIPKDYQPAYRALLAKASEYLDVEMSAPRKLRSTGPNSANAHLNGHVQQICIETGNSFEDVKLYIKRCAVARGLPLMTRDDGSVVYSLVDKEPLPISEADMTSEQCSWCIEEAHILAGELGIKLVEA